jgi:hypothetical protein
MGGMSRKLRLLLAAMLTGAALLIPAPGHAKPILNIGYFADVTSLSVNLHLKVNSDGGAQLTGFIKAGTDRLVAQPNEPAQASFADNDGDNEPGLTRLAATFSPTGQTREHVLLAIVADREIDGPGTYDLTITGGRTTLTVQAKVSFH